MNRQIAAAAWSGWGAALAALVVSSPVWVYDPIVGLGPHVFYKGGVEVATEAHVDKQGDEPELGVELVYALTGDWAAGIELPYAWKKEGTEDSSGTGDLALFTKYRFWRHDTLGAQESAAVLLKLKTGTGDEGATPALGTGTADTIIGLAYGYEKPKVVPLGQCPLPAQQRERCGPAAGRQGLV